jgi:hypothetical protein
MPGQTRIETNWQADPRKCPIIRTLIQLRRQGTPLRSAAAIAGVHVATICRWQKRDPSLRWALREASAEGRHRSARPDEPRPDVRWRRDCPLCRAKVVVRSVRGKARFWRCGRWLLCSWASWRPRAPRNCKRCGGARYYSHSRKSYVCGSCGVRTRRH